MTFIPLVNPGGFFVTQKYFDKCDILLNTIILGDGGSLQGNLRDGRFRRKNLNDNDGVLGTDSTDRRGVDDLNGVDINRNFDAATTGSDKPKSEIYRGQATAGVFEEESKAVFAAFARPWGISAGQTYTGVGVLDVHTDANEVNYFEGRSRIPANDPFARFPGEIARAVFGPTAVAKIDTANRGALDEYARTTFDVPAATLELPPDPAWLAPFNTGGRSDLNGNTHADLEFLVSDAVLPNQVDLAGNGIDAALDFAAGPPYVTQVLILQKKTTAPGYDVAATGSAAEVIYWKQWAPGANALSRALTVDNAPGERWLNGTNSLTIVVSFSKPMRAATTDRGIKPLTMASATAANLLDFLAQPGATTQWLSSQLLTQDGRHDHGARLQPLRLRHLPDRRAGPRRRDRLRSRGNSQAQDCRARSGPAEPRRGSLDRRGLHGRSLRELRGRGHAGSDDGRGYRSKPWSLQGRHGAPQAQKTLDSLTARIRAAGS